MDFNNIVLLFNYIIKNKNHFKTTNYLKIKLKKKTNKKFNKNPTLNNKIEKKS
jgi:hypothetical protein